jgi:large subunit ribosomal protein L25
VKHLPLEATTRTETGTGAAHRLRRDGFVPGVLIGHNEPGLALQVRHSDLVRVLRESGQNAMVDLDFGGQSCLAMVREFTRNPITRHIVHVDFQRVSADEAVEAMVPLVFIGHSAAQEEGGILQHEIDTLHVRALADNVPTHIDVDVSSARPGHPLHVSDIALPEGVECLTPADHVVAAVTMPRGRALEEAEGEAEEAAAEAEAVPES